MIFRLQKKLRTTPITVKNFILIFCPDKFKGCCHRSETQFRPIFIYKHKNRRSDIFYINVGDQCVSYENRAVGYQRVQKERYSRLVPYFFSATSLCDNLWYSKTVQFILGRMVDWGGTYECPSAYRMGIWCFPAR